MSMFKELTVFTAKTSIATSIITSSLFIIPAILASVLYCEDSIYTNYTFTDYKNVDKLKELTINIMLTNNNNQNKSDENVNQDTDKSDENVNESENTNTNQDKPVETINQNTDKADETINESDNINTNQDKSDESINTINDQDKIITETVNEIMNEIIDTIVDQNTNKPDETDKKISLYDELLESPNITYIIYNFNNNDNKSDDEFKNLEKFISIIVKSFKNKYDKIVILLKISSPGGSALDFMQAYDNIMRLRDLGVRVFAFVDTVAASGGYMLACACEKIICSKYSCIGSVGVVMQIHNYSELSSKIGIEEKTWTTGKYKRIFPSGAPYTDEHNNLVKEKLDKTLQTFKDIVETSRNLTDEQKNEIYAADTWIGIDAKSLNLVDYIDNSETVFNKLVENGNKVWIYNNIQKQDFSKIFTNINGLVKLVNNSILNFTTLFNDTNKHKQIKLI